MNLKKKEYIGVMLLCLVGCSISSDKNRQGMLNKNDSIILNSTGLPKKPFNTQKKTLIDKNIGMNPLQSMNFQVQKIQEKNQLNLFINQRRSLTELENQQPYLANLNPVMLDTGLNNNPFNSVFQPLLQPEPQPFTNLVVDQNGMNSNVFNPQSQINQFQNQYIQNRLNNIHQSPQLSKTQILQQQQHLLTNPVIPDINLNFNKYGQIFQQFPQLGQLPQVDQNGQILDLNTPLIPLTQSQLDQVKKEIDAMQKIGIDPANCNGLNIIFLLLIIIF